MICIARTFQNSGKDGHFLRARGETCAHRRIVSSPREITSQHVFALGGIQSVAVGRVHGQATQDFSGRRALVEHRQRVFAPNSGRSWFWHVRLQVLGTLVVLQSASPSATRIWTSLSPCDCFAGRHDPAAAGHQFRMHLMADCAGYALKSVRTTRFHKSKSNLGRYETMKNNQSRDITRGEGAGAGT